MLYFRILILLFAFLQIAADICSAQHMDILVDVIDEQLAVDSSLFLSDFRAAGVGDGDTLELQNPGYATNGANVLQPGSLLNFEIVGPLLYSDGNNWRPAENEAFFELFRPIVEGHSVIVTGKSTSQTGFPIARTDDEGTLHEHIRFRLGNQEAGPPVDGVYAVQKILTSPGLTSSAPYMLIFNHGLATPDFVRSVVAARQLIADSPFDCTGDGLLLANDLPCVVTTEQRDSVLRSIGSIVGDLDGNGEVEFSDFLTLSRNFGSDESSYAGGNIDLLDGVGFPDFLSLSRNFGFDGHETVATVPEPTSWKSLLVAFLFIFLSPRIKPAKRKGQA
jgi:hypothetical protein